MSELIKNTVNSTPNVPQGEQTTLAQAWSITQFNSGIFRLQLSMEFSVNNRQCDKALSDTIRY